MEQPLLAALPVSDNPLEGYSPYFANVGARLRTIRRHHKYTQQTIAAELNISRLTYSKYENNPKLMPLGVLLAYITLLNLKINDVLQLKTKN